MVTTKRRRRFFCCNDGLLGIQLMGGMMISTMAFWPFDGERRSKRDDNEGLNEENDEGKKKRGRGIQARQTESC